MKFILGLAAIALLGCSSAKPVDWNVGTPRSNCTSVDAGQTGQEDGSLPVNVWNQHENDWLQTSPKINLVYWGKYWTNAGYGYLSYSTNALETILNDPAFYKPMQEYGIGPGTLDGVYLSNRDIVAQNISDPDIQSEILSQINNNVLPPPSNDGNTMYVIMLPQNTPIARCTNNSCSGYHWWLNYNGTNFTYAVVDFNEQSDFIVIAHEVYEATSDPTLDEFNGGWGQAEIADLCGGQYYILDGWQIQKLWSQNSCECIPAQ